MSATIPTTPTTTDPESTWARPAVSIFALVIFVVAFVIAYLSKSDTALNLMTGATISMATSVTGYYLGSSSGSARKDTALMAAATAPTTTTTSTLTPPMTTTTSTGGGAPVVEPVVAKPATA